MILFVIVGEFMPPFRNKLYIFFLFSLSGFTQCLTQRRLSLNETGNKVTNGKPCSADLYMGMLKISYAPEHRTPPTLSPKSLLMLAFEYFKLPKVQSASPEMQT